MSVFDSAAAHLLRKHAPMSEAAHAAIGAAGGAGLGLHRAPRAALKAAHKNLADMASFVRTLTPEERAAAGVSDDIAAGLAQAEAGVKAAKGAVMGGAAKGTVLGLGLGNAVGKARKERHNARVQALGNKLELGALGTLALGSGAGVAHAFSKDKHAGVQKTARVITPMLPALISRALPARVPATAVMRGLPAAEAATTATGAQSALRAGAAGAGAPMPSTRWPGDLVGRFRYPRQGTGGSIGGSSFGKVQPPTQAGAAVPVAARSPASAAAAVPPTVPPTVAGAAPAAAVPAAPVVAGAGGAGSPPLAGGAAAWGEATRKWIAENAAKFGLDPASMLDAATPLLAYGAGKAGQRPAVDWRSLAMPAGVGLAAGAGLGALASD